MIVIGSDPLFRDATSTLGVTCMLCDRMYSVVGTLVATDELRVERWFVCSGCLSANPITIRESLRRRAEERGRDAEELLVLADQLEQEDVGFAQARTLVDWNEQLDLLRKRIRRRDTS